MIAYVRRLVPLALLLLGFASLAPALAADDIPEDARSGITAALKKRVSDLLGEKDKDGIAFKRGSYSQNFKKVDDTTYLASFHQDTIEPEEDGKTDHMKVERYTLTVSKDGSNWKVTDQKLEDTWVGLYRNWMGTGETFHFDSLAFEHEGLKVTASNGYFYTSNALGKVMGMRVTADDLTYTYTPPAGVEPWYAAKNHEILRKFPQDIQFTPEWLQIDCDPATCGDFLKTVFQGVTKLAAPTAGSAKFQKVFDDRAKDRDKDLKENPFSGFYLPHRPDRKEWSFLFKRDGAKEHYFNVDYDSYQPWEVRVYASGYFAALFAYYSEETRKSGEDPYRLERRDEVEAQEYEIRSIDGEVSVALDDAETLDGDISYVLRAKKQVRELPIFIPQNRAFTSDAEAAKRPTFFVNSIRDDQGNELTWARVNPYYALLILPEAVPAGNEIRLKLQWRSTGSIYKVNPSYSAMNRGGWLPLVRFGDMIEKFALRVKSPAKYEVLGIGHKLEERLDGNVRFTSWASSSPVSFPTIIFGDYISDKSSYVATKADGEKIPVTVWVDKVSTQALDTNITSQEKADEFRRSLEVGSRDIRGKQLGAIAVQASVALDLYKQVYGIDYPFEKLDLVADPLGSFYGQAPASIIYLGFGVFRGEGEVAAGNLFSGGAGISKFNKDVVAHETGHQWWGSAIANANDRNYWFVESLAEYSSALYVEKVFGKSRYLDKVADWRRNILEADPLSTVQSGYTVWGGGGGSAQANIYNKGPYAFHILRSTFGDEKFFAFLKKLAQELKGKEIVTRDIQRVSEEAFGGNMDWFFDQWIRGVGTPQYAVFYTKRQTEDGKWLIEGTIRQRVVIGEKDTELPGVYYRAVAPLTFVGFDGKKTRTPRPILVQGAETKFQLKVPAEPAEVRFNDEGEILAKDVLYNRTW